MYRIEHQPREHAVTCQMCHHERTWSFNAVCDPCDRSSWDLMDRVEWANASGVHFS